MKMTPILEARNLTKVFTQHGRPDLIAVNDVSFTLMEGEVLGIVGESGSGKSTIAKMLTNLTEITGGSVFVDGEDVTNAKGAKLRGVYSKLQMVFQTPVGSFDPRKTLGYGIGESLRNKGASKAAQNKRVAELLEQCGLPAEFANRYPHEVSGGQCQRAAIARALACEPKILIFDEATSALDVTVQKQILELLQQLQKDNGLSYIFICHNLALVQQLCDKVIVLYDGKIAESGTPDEVILHPKSEYAQRLLDAVFE
jgi:peptide/nickel transport system ATP-binding protein